MTPLANQLLKSPDWNKNRSFIELLSGCHFFDVSEIVECMEMLADTFSKMPIGEQAAHFNERLFLPAPKTWLEWYRPLSKTRVALLIIERENDNWHELYYIDFRGLWPIAIISAISDDYRTDGGDYPAHLAPVKTREGFAATAHLMLAMINTPQVFGRRQHMPLRRAEKRMADALGIQGSFPLKAWTEIQLAIGVPKDMRGDGPYEAHLTGKKALHFCRAHLRYRCGKIEVVRSHWRGDASVGIKRSRYNVVPARPH